MCACVRVCVCVSLEGPRASNKLAGLSSVTLQVKSDNSEVGGGTAAVEGDLCTGLPAPDSTGRRHIEPLGCEGARKSYITLPAGDVHDMAA